MLLVEARSRAAYEAWHEDVYALSPGRHPWELAWLVRTGGWICLGLHSICVEEKADGAG